MSKLTQQKEFEIVVPGYDAEFGTRLKWVIDQIGTQKKAGEIADVKPEMIAKYVAGRAKPSFYTIRDLAKAARKSLDWLATGEEKAIRSQVAASIPSGDHLDVALFSEIICLVEQWLDDNNHTLSPNKKGDVIATLYEIALATVDKTGVAKVNPNTIGRILNLIT